MSELSKLNTRAPLDRSPKSNWVEEAGGLPMYIRRIANHLHAEKGMTISRAIAVAVNAVKRMCSTGDLNWKGRQNVNAGSRAEACGAVADWERKKAQARVSKGVLGRKWTDEEFIGFLVNDANIHKAMDCGCGHSRRKGKKKKKALMQRPLEKRFFSMEERKSKKTTTYPGTTKFPVTDQSSFNDAWGLRGNSSIPKEKVERWLRGLAKRKGYKIPGDVSKIQISDEEFEIFHKEIDAEFNADSHGVESFEAIGEIEKMDADKQMVFGWCSIAKHKDGTVEVDKQGDVLEDIDQMEAVAYDFVLNSRDGGEMHVRKGVSTMIESFVSTPEKWEAMEIPEGVLPVGWWVGFKVNDREVWKGVKSGKYKMFSVHGSGTRKALD